MSYTPVFTQESRLFFLQLQWDCADFVFGFIPSEYQGLKEYWDEQLARQISYCEISYMELN